MSYRVYMPVILDQLGFPVTADYFDEPEEIQMEADRVVERPEDLEEKKKKGKFGFFGRKNNGQAKPSRTGSVSRPPSTMPRPLGERKVTNSQEEDRNEEQPPRIDLPRQDKGLSDQSGDSPGVPAHAGFDFHAISNVLEEARHSANKEASPTEDHSGTVDTFNIPPPIQRSESAPTVPLQVDEPSTKLPDDSFDFGDTTAHKRAFSQEPRSEFSTNTEEDDFGDITSHALNARPPPAPSIPSSGIGQGAAWSIDADGYGITLPRLPTPQTSYEPEHEADDGDITAGGGWGPPSSLTPKPAIFSNPWDT